MSKLTLLKTLGFVFLAGCQLKTQGGAAVQTADPPSPVRARVYDFVSENLFELTQHSPILLLCRYRADPSKTVDVSKPFDLIIQRRESITTEKAPYDFYFHVTPTGNHPFISFSKLMAWTVSASALSPFQEEGERFHALIFWGGTGFQYFKGRPIGSNNAILYNAGPEGQLMRCEEGSKLADKSPQPGDELVISATPIDTFISLSVTVDGLLADENGSEKIMSNSKPHGHSKLDGTIKGAPVFSRSNELVGFVEEYNPETPFGIKIQSIHDPRYGTALNKVIAQKKWVPNPPQKSDPRLSPRFINLCSQCRDSFFKSICVSAGATRPTSK